MRPLRTGWPHEFADMRLLAQVALFRTLGIERFSMSKDNIQDVVRKSLEKYFRDLGEMQPHNVYEMVVFTVEKPMLEAVMGRAKGNQSHAAEMLGINRNTLRKKLPQHGLL